MRRFIFTVALLVLAGIGVIGQRGVYAKSKATPSPTPIKVVTPTPRTGGLTDQEYNLSKTYVHEGYLAREAKELCEGMEDICRGDEAKFKFMGISNDMMKIVSRCYSTVVGSMSAAGLLSLPNIKKIIKRSMEHVKN